MTNLSVTDLEQSKALVNAGLDAITADYAVLVKLKKANGVISVEETPFPNDGVNYGQGLNENKNFTAAWSLGRLVEMLPAEITSAYDVDGNEQPEEYGVTYRLVMGKTSVEYVSEDGRRRLTTNGAYLLDAVVEMILSIKKEDYDLEDE